MEVYASHIAITSNIQYRVNKRPNLKFLIEQCSDKIIFDKYSSALRKFKDQLYNVAFLQSGHQHRLFPNHLVLLQQYDNPKSQNMVNGSSCFYQFFFFSSLLKIDQLKKNVAEKNERLSQTYQGIQAQVQDMYQQLMNEDDGSFSDKTVSETRQYTHGPIKVSSDA